MINKLKTEYYDWLCSLVYDSREATRVSYKKLLRYLGMVPFVAKLDMDENRAADGQSLRYRFGYEKGYDDRLIASYLDVRPCSVLEMMVALAYRCEEHIMSDDRFGDRTGQWFWNMIVSLGLGYMTDSRFDREQARDILEKFMNREYDPDGRGGLVTLRDPTRDLREVEIWTQMMWYLNEVEP